MRGYGFGRGRGARRRVLAALPAAPALRALALSGATLAENAAAGAVVGEVTGLTAGSTLAMLDGAGGRFALSASTLVAGGTACDFELATTHQVVVRETLAGAANSPRDTVLAVSVANRFEQPALQPLALGGAASLALGTPATGAVTGATAGSALVAAALPAGLSVDGSARTWAWSGSGSAGTAVVQLTETLADSANSPRTTDVPVTVAADTLPAFRAALAAAKAGTAGPLVVNVVGDSTVAGTGAGLPASALGNNARGSAIGQQLAEAFVNGSGLSRNGADVFGFNFTVNTGTAADYAAFNTAVAPGGWTFVANLKSLGGNMWNAQAATGGAFTWTAEGRSFDRLVLYYPRNTSLGSMQLLIDGAVVQTISCAGAAALGRTAVSVAPGSHTVALRWASGSVYLIGMEAIDTTAPRSVRVRNLGQGSARSGDIVSNANAWDARPTLAGIDPAHLHVVEGGVVNDWLQSVAVATTSGNLGTLLTAAQTRGGDVLLLGPARSNPAATGIAAATQQGYADAMAGLANGRTRLFFDLKSAVGDYAAMAAAGRMFDNVHPNAAGYGAAAAAIHAALTA